MPSPWVASRILDRFRSLSSEMNDGFNKSAFYRDVSPGIVNLYLRDVRASLRRASGSEILLLLPFTSVAVWILTVAS